MGAAGTKNIRRVVSTFLLFTLWLVVTCATSARAASPAEYQVKAAFLLHFTRFIEWPATAFPSGPSSLVICVVGQDPFGAALDRTVKGQAVDGKSLVVRRIKQLQRDESCHVAFVGASEENKLDELLGAIKNSPVLTVGDVENFAAAGGMINLVVEEQKIRFEINLESAERAGLKISSRLLQLAKNVREGKRP